MNVLITGGLGYVGGRIANFLGKKDRYNITVTTHREKFKIPEDLNNITVKHANILDRDKLTTVCENIDYVIHLVGSNEIVSAEKPHDALKVTTEGTLNLLEAAIETGVKKFMYFSTFHVYGFNKGVNISEKTPPNPIHPYSITHYFAELYVNQFRQNHDLETIILRLSNSFGSPITTDVNRWTLLVNDLCYQAIKSGRLELKSSGEQHRDFTPLSDVVTAVDLLLNTSHDKLGDGIFNVGSGQSMSVIEMCNLINDVYEKNYGKKLSIITPPDATKENGAPLFFDISKIRNIGFKPSDDYELEILNTLRLCEEKVKEE